MPCRSTARPLHRSAISSLSLTPVRRTLSHPRRRSTSSTPRSPAARTSRAPLGLASTVFPVPRPSTLRCHSATRRSASHQACSTWDVYRRVRATVSGQSSARTACHSGSSATRSCRMCTRHSIWGTTGSGSLRSSDYPCQDTACDILILCILNKQTSFPVQPPPRRRSMCHQGCHLASPYFMVDGIRRRMTCQRLNCSTAIGSAKPRLYIQELRTTSVRLIAPFL